MTMAERMAMFAPAGTRPPAGPVVPATTSGTGPTAVADGDGALRVPAVPRRDTPVVRNVVRGGSAAALTGLRNDGLDQLVSELESGRFARSATAPRISLLKTWSRFHAAAFGVGPGAIPEYPITVRSFVAVAALFKRGGYRAFPNYASAAKDRHIQLGHVWTQQLDGASRWCTRSVQRGIGPARQSKPLWLSNMLNLIVGKQPLAAGGCVAPYAMTMLACMFLLREIEVDLQ